MSADRFHDTLLTNIVFFYSEKWIFKSTKPSQEWQTVVILYVHTFLKPFFLSIWSNHIHLICSFFFFGFRPKVKKLVLVRSPKLSNIESGHYLDGWSLLNTRCCEPRCADGVIDNDSELGIGEPISNSKVGLAIFAYAQIPLGKVRIHLFFPPTLISMTCISKILIISK